MAITSERYDVVRFQLSAQADADGVAGEYLGSGFTIVGYSVFGSNSGTPSTATIDIQEGGTDVATGLDIATPGYFALTSPVTISAETALEIDVNFTGGTSPAFTGSISLHGLLGS